MRHKNRGWSDMIRNNEHYNKVETLSGETRSIPVYNIRMMSDDEWNRLAYKNYLERQAKANG